MEQTVKTAAILTIIVTILTTIQGIFPMIPGVTEGVLTILSTIVMYVVGILTLWKQRISEEINNDATIPTWIVLAIAAVAGLNDIFDVVTLSAATDQWVRFGITAVLLILNMISKMQYPTSQTKSAL